MNLGVFNANVDNEKNEDVKTSKSSNFPYHQVFRVSLMFLTLLFAMFSNLRAAQANSAQPQNQMEEAQDAAKGMESMFVHQMIQELRKSVPENELIPKSQGERIFEAMLDQEYSQILTNTGNFGIRDQVLAEIQGKR